MKAELACTDITENLCQHCAYCCLKTLLPVNALTSQTYEYLVMVMESRGFSVYAYDEDDGTLLFDMGACPYLRRKGEMYGCGVHGTAARPKKCKKFNCAAWAAVGEEDNTVFTDYALGIYNWLNGGESSGE